MSIVAHVAFFIQHALNDSVHLLGQANNDIVLPRNLHSHHNLELARTQMN